jgi:hypothetical protein
MDETTAVKVSRAISSGNWEDEFTLSNQAIEVLIVGSLNAQVASADVIDGLVIDHETAVGVLEGGVGGEDRVVWLDH